MMYHDLLIRKDLEGSGCGIVDILSSNLLAGTKSTNMSVIIQLSVSERDVICFGPDCLLQNIKTGSWNPHSLLFNACGVLFREQSGGMGSRPLTSI